MVAAAVHRRRAEQEFRSGEPEGCPVRPVRWCVAVTGAMRVQAGHIRGCPFPDIRAKDSQHGSGPRARRAGFSARVARQKREQTPDGRVHAPPRRVGRRRGTDPTTLGRPADACIRDAASARAAPRPHSPWTRRSGVAAPSSARGAPASRKVSGSRPRSWSSGCTPAFGRRWLRITNLLSRLTREEGCAPCFARKSGHEAAHA